MSWSWEWKNNVFFAEGLHAWASKFWISLTIKYEGKKTISRWGVYLYQSLCKIHSRELNLYVFKSFENDTF